MQREKWNQRGKERKNGEKKGFYFHNKFNIKLLSFIRLNMSSLLVNSFYASLCFACQDDDRIFPGAHMCSQTMYHNIINQNTLHRSRTMERCCKMYCKNKYRFCSQWLPKEIYKPKHTISEKEKRVYGNNQGKHEKSFLSCNPLYLAFCQLGFVKWITKNGIIPLFGTKYNNILLRLP